MTVRIRLFAMLRERAGRDELELELPEGARVADALAALDHLAGGLSLVLAVNREYAAPDAVLRAGDELALIPPVSGGAGGTASGAGAAGGAGGPHVRVTDEPLSLDAVTALVRDPRAGAVVTFQGVTREVDHLDYEAYAEMAVEAMRTILAAAIERHGLCAAAAEHRVGTVALGEPSVVVAVSAPHRGEAFAGAREAIDALKASAPIWKKEVEAGGEERWVGGESPRPPVS
jgi:molybdopterin converting factor subunit 1